MQERKARTRRENGSRMKREDREIARGKNIRVLCPVSGPRAGLAPAAAVPRAGLAVLAAREQHKFFTKSIHPWGTLVIDSYAGVLRTVLHVVT